MEKSSLILWVVGSGPEIAVEQQFSRKGTVKAMQRQWVGIDGEIQMELIHRENY